jgi:hypothetical protein
MAVMPSVIDSIGGLSVHPTLPFDLPTYNQTGEKTAGKVQSKIGQVEKVFGQYSKKRGRWRGRDHHKQDRSWRVIRSYCYREQVYVAAVGCFKPFFIFLEP